MKLTIFNVFVPMENQEQCDRMKQLCIDNVLNIWDNFFFLYNKKEYKYFYYYDDEFCNWLEQEENYSELTEQQFIELLKEYKLNN